MAATEDKIVPWSTGELGSGPAAASTTFYLDTACFITAAGLIDDDTGTGLNRFAGLVTQQVDNSSGTAGAKTVEFRRYGVGTFPGTGFTQADVGKLLYATDNFTFTITPSASAVPVGTITEYLSSTAVRADIEGVKTPTNMVQVAAVTAAGSTAADAAALGRGLNIVTGADGTKGVILPVAVPGQFLFVKGVTAGVLKVYPQTSSTINALSASAAMSLASGATPAIFIASSTTQWYTFPLLPS